MVVKGDQRNDLEARWLREMARSMRKSKERGHFLAKQQCKKVERQNRRAEVGDHHRNNTQITHYTPHHYRGPVAPCRGLILPVGLDIARTQRAAHGESQGSSAESKLMENRETQKMIFLDILGPFNAVADGLSGRSMGLATRFRENAPAQYFDLLLQKYKIDLGNKAVGIIQRPESVMAGGKGSECRDGMWGDDGFDQK